MSWSYTSLSCLLWYQEEVKALVVVLVFYKLTVDDTSWLRITGLSISVSNKHPLVNSLVHNYESEGRLGHLIVKRLDGCLELSDLLLHDLVSHLLADTIPVDDNLCWVGSLVGLGELLESTDKASVKVLLHNLLVLLLNDDVGEILSALWICRGSKPDHRLLTCVANINTNYHHSLLLHESWHLDSHGLTTDL